MGHVPHEQHDLHKDKQGNKGVSLWQWVVVQQVVQFQT